MKFYISKASTIKDHEPPAPGAVMVEGGSDPCWAIEVGSLDDLFALMETVEASVVIYPKHSLDHPWLTIYDDYLE